MPAFDPTLLAQWTGGRWNRRPDRALRGFSVDSRSLAAGEAFVALKTEKRDGHDFVSAAAAAGAVAALVGREVGGAALAQLIVPDPLAALQEIARQHRRLFRGRVLAVTGSAGKTSTKEVLALLLGGPQAGVLATRGNLNNHIGVALTLTGLDPTQHRCAVVEAGISAPSEMRVLASMIEPDVALVTLVGPAHLQELGDLEGVAREKAALFGALRPGGTCVFPKSCLAHAAFRSTPGRAIVVEPAPEPLPAPSDARAYFSARHTSEATEVLMATAGNAPFTLSIARVGDGMAQNLALAAVAALAAGVPAGCLAGRLSGWAPAPLRGEWREWRGRRVFLDCYNANPASMSEALATFVASTPQKGGRTFVIGCMEELGEASLRYHEDLGRLLPLGPADRALVVGDMGAAVVAGAREAGRAGQVEAFPDIDAAASSLGNSRGPIFVKGSRRHQLERAFAGPGVSEVVHA